MNSVLPELAIPAKLAIFRQSCPGKTGGLAIFWRFGKKFGDFNTKKHWRHCPKNVNKCSVEKDKMSYKPCKQMSFYSNLEKSQEIKLSEIMPMDGFLKFGGCSFRIVCL